LLLLLAPALGFKNAARKLLLAPEDVAELWLWEFPLLLFKLKKRLPKLLALLLSVEPLPTAEEEPPARNGLLLGAFEFLENCSTIPCTTPLLNVASKFAGLSSSRELGWEPPPGRALLPLLPRGDEK